MFKDTEYLSSNNINNEGKEFQTFIEKLTVTKVCLKFTGHFPTHTSLSEERYVVITW